MSTESTQMSQANASPLTIGETNLRLPPAKMPREPSAGMFSMQNTSRALGLNVYPTIISSSNKRGCRLKVKVIQGTRKQKKFSLKHKHFVLGRCPHTSQRPPPHADAQRFRQVHRGPHGVWPGHDHFKTPQEVLGETEKAQMKSSVRALPWRMQKDSSLQGTMGSRVHDAPLKTRAAFMTPPPLILDKPRRDTA